MEINEEEGSAHLDFEGTGAEVRGNLNAPISVVHSSVIYCMRAMLDVDIPLNAGCLVPVTGTFTDTYMLFVVRRIGSPYDEQSRYRRIPFCTHPRLPLYALGTFSRRKES